MAILTASQDELRGDKLKADPLATEYDPVGKLESKRVETYDKELGFALHPEQKDYLNTRKDLVNADATAKEKALKDYQENFNKELTAADVAAQQQLGQIQEPTMDLTTIRVMNGSTIEQEYVVPRSIAEELAKEKTLATGWFGEGAYFNVDVKPIGTSDGYGKELHEALGEAAVQTQAWLKMAHDETALYRRSAQEEINAQRQMAMEGYNQNVDQATKIIGATRAIWTNFVRDQRQAFARGIERNTGGIKDLLDSGALVMGGRK